MSFGRALSNVYMPQSVEVDLVTRETGDVKTFRFAFTGAASDVEFVPGQFVVLSILGVGECPMSIASSPTDGPWVEITVRNMGTVTGALHRGPRERVLGMRGPFGNGFDISKLKNRPLLLVAGGIGLAPLRSLVHYIDYSREDFGPVTIIYGVRTPDDRLYRDELQSWRKAPGFRVLEIAEEDPENVWDGPVGKVTDLFGELQGDYRKAAAVLCGPLEMVDPVIERLEGLSIPLEDVQAALERRMSCGVGKCGHCYIGDKFVCTDGPVFTAAEIKRLSPRG